jgi:hypothetical protein
MSGPATPSGQPTPDDLAGIPVCHEEDGPTRGARKRRGGRNGPGRTGDRTPPPAPPGLPTADDLAGIPVSADGEKNPTGRPRKPRRRQ